MLRSVERDLKLRFGAAAEEAQSDSVVSEAQWATPFDTEPYPVQPPRPHSKHAAHEFSVPSWKSVFEPAHRGSNALRHGNPIDLPTEVLAQSRQDLINLWQDDLIHEMLRRKKIDFENRSGL